MRKDIGLWRWLFAIIRLDPICSGGVWQVDLLVVVVVAGDVIVSVNVFVV